MITIPPEARGGFLRRVARSRLCRTSPLPQPRRLHPALLPQESCMWRTAFRVMLATVLASTPALAQTGTISGQVLAVEGGAPLSRVQVTIPGTGAGALTRDDGRYTIAIRPG